MKDFKTNIPMIGFIDYSVIRNAGGRSVEALRSIICMDQLVGVAAVVVVHHTGMFIPSYLLLFFLLLLILLLLLLCYIFSNCF
jgi:hypothetical protein